MNRLLPLLLCAAASALHAEVRSHDLQTPASDRATAQALRQMPWKDCQIAVEPLWEEAGKALAEGRHDDAVEGFARIADVLPDSTKKLSALACVVRAHSQAGRKGKAREACDVVIFEAKRLLTRAYYGPESTQKSKHADADSVRDLMRRSLLQKAELSMELGAPEDALAVVRSFRAAEPEFFYLRQIRKRPPEPLLTDRLFWRAC